MTKVSMVTETIISDWTTILVLYLKEADWGYPKRYYFEFCMIGLEGILNLIYRFFFKFEVHYIPRKG